MQNRLGGPAAGDSDGSAYDEKEFAAAVALLADTAPPPTVGGTADLDSSLHAAFVDDNHDDGGDDAGNSNAGQLAGVDATHHADGTDRGDDSEGGLQPALLPMQADTSELDASLAEAGFAPPVPTVADTDPSRISQPGGPPPGLGARGPTKSGNVDLVSDSDSAPSAASSIIPPLMQQFAAQRQQQRQEDQQQNPTTESSRAEAAHPITPQQQQQRALEPRPPAAGVTTVRDPPAHRPPRPPSTAPAPHQHQQQRFGVDRRLKTANLLNQNDESPYAHQGNEDTESDDDDNDDHQHRGRRREDTNRDVGGDGDTEEPGW